MNTLDDLRTALDGYADRGDHRGADAVLAAARSGPQAGASADARPAMWARLLAVAAVAVAVVATVALVRSRSDDVGLTTTPDQTDSVPRALAPITVSDGLVNVVHVGFDRVWVGTSSDGIVPARLRSFDVITGGVTSEIELRGSPTAIASTDGALWVQIGEPPTAGAERPDPPADSTLARIDPVAGTVVAETPLFGAGPMAARGSRLAVADLKTLTIIDDALGTVATASIPDAIGHDNVVATDTGPEPAGLAALAFGPDSLTALYLRGLPDQAATSRKAGELVTVDPDTALHRATRMLDPAHVLQQLVARAGTTTWLAPIDRDLVRVDDERNAEPIGADPTQIVPVGDRVIGLAPFGNGVVALTATEAVVIGDGPPLRTPLSGPARSIVELDGRPWVARWTDMIGPTPVVSFELVRTDADGPPATFQEPTTDRTPASTVVGDGIPQLLVMPDAPLVDGGSYPVMGAGLPPGDAFLRVCLDEPAAVGGDCWAPAALPNQIVTVGDSGQLKATWISQRSVYDDRWHDCATESCSLRLLAANDAGGVDIERVLAAAPLRFAGDSPPVRPTLSLDAEGPLTIGTKGLITGSDFLPLTKGISVGTCRAGDQDGSCRFDLAAGVSLVADEAGRFTVTYAVRSRTITVPANDPAGGEEIDCSVPGSCSLSIFLDDSSREPYATLPITILR